MTTGKKKKNPLANAADARDSGLIRGREGC